MDTFTADHFESLVKPVTDAIKDMPVDSDLEAFLNQQFPPESEIFKAIESACHKGIEQGEVCQHEHGGIRYGRVIKPVAALSGFSVDVVQMEDVVGPHHRHPLGEVDMIMPITSEAKFDGKGAGWKVYGPDSAHKPTVTEGNALVLYLLPEGEIDFGR